jgi:hypothetical protein
VQTYDDRARLRRRHRDRRRRAHSEQADPNEQAKTAIHGDLG